MRDRYNITKTHTCIQGESNQLNRHTSHATQQMNKQTGIIFTFPNLLLPFLFATSPCICNLVFIRSNGYVTEKEDVQI